MVWIFLLSSEDIASSLGYTFSKTSVESERTGIILYPFFLIFLIPFTKVVFLVPDCSQPIDPFIEIIFFHSKTFNRTTYYIINQFIILSFITNSNILL